MVSPGVAPFEVHEWGVIDITQNGPIELAAGPGHPKPDAPRIIRKPVLYFHLDPGASSLEIAVEATLPRGVMLEAWPRGELTRASIRWPRVRLGSCPTPSPTIASEMGALRASGWPTGDGFNEVFELASYETSDATCLATRDALARLLFYRGSIAPVAMPLSIIRDANGRIGMRADVAAAGNVYFSAEAGRGLVLPWPPVGTTVLLPEKLTESFDASRMADALSREITVRGLTRSEADAFMRAWTTSFFGGREPGLARDIRESEPPTSRRAAPTPGPMPAILYLMPDSTVAQVAELSITPKPRAVKRVIVVHHEVVR